MIVSWKDENGVERWADEHSKDYKRYLENKPAEKPAAKPVVVTPTVDEAKRK